MTLTKSDVTELLDAIRAGGDLDVIRKGVELVLQALIDVEATEAIGAERYERTDSRRTWRDAPCAHVGSVLQPASPARRRRAVGGQRLPAPRRGATKQRETVAGR